MTWDRFGAGHTDIWMERWACGHSSKVIHSHTQGNFVQCYVCMHIRICVSLCTNAAMVLQHVTSMSHTKQLMYVSCKAKCCAVTSPIQYYLCMGHCVECT